VDPATGESCRWHHGLWPWLRLMGLATSPARFAEFYRAAFEGEIARSGAARVLLSGAADFEMLAQAASAFAARGVVPELTLIDLCETPLAQSRRYAERSGIRMTTQRVDLLEYAAEHRFDAISSDSFLGQFTPRDRERLIARWASLLRPGGAVITVNRLRPDADPERRVGFSEEQAHDFVAAVTQAALALPEAQRPEPGELAACAARYAARQGAWPVRSAAELEALFARGGFEIAQLEVGPIAGEAARPSAPTLAGGSHYARVVARKR
jgi:SAM-dependent methyltransferase